MKSAVSWFLLGIFALQTTGVLTFAHLADCCEPEKAASCQCGRGQDAGASTSACEGSWAVRPHPACPDKPAPHRHDPQKCSICQFLLMLAAPMGIAPALPAIDQVASERPAPPERPAAATFRSTLDARGPPTCTLCPALFSGYPSASSAVPVAI